MELYWLLRLPHLHSLFEIIAALSFGIGAFCFIMSEGKSRKFSLFCVLISFISTILLCLCPDKTDLALMLGWDALKSETVQEVIEILKDKIK